MLKDLRVVERSTRKKPGMKEFFILVLCYSYYNRNFEQSNEISISETVLADYFDCTTKTIYRWLCKLKDINCIKQAERENAGKTGYYKEKDENGKLVKKSYIIPKYKKIRVGEKDECKFVNVYTVNQTKLNNYLIETIDEDVFGNIDKYKEEYFDKYIIYLKGRNVTIEKIENEEISEEDLDKDDKQKLKREKEIKQRIKENDYYLKLKEKQDKKNPEFICRYLKEGCLRLTHEICNTVNPEHTEKIDESNYWRSSHARNDMLINILNVSDFEEKDVNGSIYRLTYNLNHDKLLDVNEDIYSLIWKEAFDVSWPDSSYRNTFKKILMPIYMKEYLIGYRCAHYEYIEKYFVGHPRKYKKLSIADKDLYETHHKLLELTGMTNLKDFLHKVSNAMHEVLNTKKFMGSKIFIQESNLHILMRERFNDIGIKCANIYDGFYFKKSEMSTSEFYAIYTSAVFELKHNLSNNIGTPA